jgi:SAM-dependent methyltransferase
VLAAARDRVLRRQGEFNVARCTGCGLVATLPRPDEAQLRSYYEGAYSGGTSAVVRAYQRGAIGRWVARRRAAAVGRHVALRSGTIVEVGCGYGALLRTLHEDHGCTVVGVDSDEGSLAQALRRDAIAYHCGTLESLGLPAARFDAVLFFQSLEHHRDPVRALAEAARLLKPGGVCVVEVPDFDGFWRHVFGTWWYPLLVPQHLFHFTRASLAQAFAAAGLTLAGPHRSMFYPLESTVSLGLWLNERLGRPLRRFQPRLARPDGWLLFALLAAWWVCVEVPVQALLVAAGRSGHQLMAARRPPDENPAPEHTRSDP